VKLGEGLVGWAALHKEPVLVSDVSQDPRYINLVADARSELVIPMLIKDRCIGVFDLESPELDAFTKEHKELLTLLASQAAVAIENARLYEEVRRNEERIERELRFAQRVQRRCCPTEPPAAARRTIWPGASKPARELGGDLHDFLCPSRTRSWSPSATSPARARRPRSTARSPPSSCARARCGAATRRIAVQRLGRAARHEHDAARAAARGVLLHALLRLLRLQRGHVTVSNSGLPYPIRCSGDECAQIELPGVPLGSFPRSTYDQIAVALHPGDVYVFCVAGGPSGLSTPP
jgi:phosphoserine phosphatase RsbU/P